LVSPSSEGRGSVRLERSGSEWMVEPAGLSPTKVELIPWVSDGNEPNIAALRFLRARRRERKVFSDCIKSVMSSVKAPIETLSPF